MPLNALLLVLCAALLHATCNIAAKKAGGDHRFALGTVAHVLPVNNLLLGHFGNLLRLPMLLAALLGEHGRGLRLAGAACIAGGVVSLALG